MKVGTDITCISRYVAKDDLAQRILSKKELELYYLAPKREVFLAGRFAAKEAFIKAQSSLSFQGYATIEVLYDAFGAPYIFYKKETYAVSISHDGDYAMAVVVI